ncbi:UPF0236 family protein [Geobacillus sp. YHL]|nr:UPF0236 family protein [Geobacillus sp. YHL]
MKYWVKVANGKASNCIYIVRTLQKVFAVLLAALLEEIDQQLAEARDKRRYQLKDKRPTTIQTLFVNYHFISEQKSHFFAHSFRKPSPLF